MPSGATLLVIYPQDTPNTGRYKINYNFSILAFSSFTGLAASIFTNPNPTTRTVGGIQSGTTFAGDYYLQDMMDLLLYPATTPNFTSFLITSQATSLEVGETVAGIKTFTWNIANWADLQPNSIDIEDTTNSTIIATNLADDGTETVFLSSVSRTTPGANIWTISAQDTDLVTFSREYQINWYYASFYGISVSTTLNAAGIVALTGTSLVSDIDGSYPLAGSGYGYICVPDAFSTPNGFRDSITNLPVEMAGTSEGYNYFDGAFYYDSVSVTRNAIPITYRVYRTRNTITSSTIAVSLTGGTVATLQSVINAGNIANGSAAILGNFSATTFFSGSSELSSLFGPSTFVAPGVNAYTGGTPSRPIVGVIGSPVFTAVTASSISGTSISATTLFSGNTNIGSLFGPSTFVAPGVNAYTGGTATRPIVGVIGSPVFTAVTASSISGTSISATTIFSGSTDLSQLIGSSTLVQPGTNISTGGTPSRPIVGVIGSPVFTAVTASSISGTSISATTFFSGSTDLGQILVAPDLNTVLNVGNTGQTSIILQGDGIVGDVFPFDLVRKVIFRETNPALSGSSDPSIGIDYNVGLIGSLFLESPLGIYHQAKIGPFDISLFPTSLSPHHQFVGGAGTTGAINLGWLSANTGNEHVFRYIQLGSLNTTSSIGGDILLIASGLTGNRIINFPDRSGIVALEDGIVSNLDDVLNSGNTAYSKNMILSGSSAVFSGGSIFAGVDIEVDTVFDPLNPYNILGASIIGGTSPSLSANTNNSVILGGSNNRIFDSPTSSVFGGTNSHIFQLQNSSIINSVDSSVSGFGYTFYNNVPRTIIGSINSNINDDGAWFGSYNELVEISNSKNSSISSSSSSAIRSSLDSSIQIGSTYSEILNSNTVQLQGSYLNVLGSLNAQISGFHSSIINSISSTVTGGRSLDIGGHTNFVYTNRSIALGTTGTTFSSDGSIAIGGISHNFPSIGGSNLNPSYSVILGGRNSTMSHSGSTILGGFGIASEAHNTVFMPNAKSLGGMSAATFYSGTTDLSDLFGSGGLSTYVQPGVNISTGGTPSRPVVNVIGSPVFTAVTASSISGTSVSAITFFSGTSDLSGLFGPSTYVAPGVNAYTGGTATRPIVGVVGSPVFTAVTATSVSGTSVSATTLFSGSTNLDSLFGPSTFVQSGVNIATGGTPSRPVVNVVGSPVFTAVTASSVSGTSVSATTFFSGSSDLSGLFGPSTFVAPGVNAYTGGTATRPIVGVVGSPVFTAVTATSVSGTSVSATTIFSGSSDLNSLFGPSTFVAPGVNAYTGGTATRPIVGVIGSPVFTAVTASSVSGTSVSATTFFSGSSNLSGLFGPSTFVAPGVNAYTGGTATRPIVGVIGSPVFTAVTASSISGTSISGVSFYSGSTSFNDILSSISVDVSRTYRTSVRQASHGLSIGSLVYMRTNGDHTVANSNSLEESKVVGMVTDVIDADSFELTTEGYCDLSLLTTILPVLSPGVTYYLTKTPGVLNPSPPTAGELIKPVFVGIDASVFYLWNGTAEMSRTGFEISTGNTSSIRTLLGLATNSDVTFNSLSATSSVIAASISATTFFSGSTNLNSLFGPSTFVAPGVNAYTGGTASRPIVGVIGSPVFTAVTASSVSGTSISATTIFSGSTNIGSLFSQAQGRTLYVSKNGDDTNGSIPSKAFTTLSGAVSYYTSNYNDASSANGFTIKVLDTSNYYLASTLTIPNYVYVDCSKSDLYGQVIMGDGAKLWVKNHYATSNGTKLVTKSGITTTTYYKADVVDSRGSGGTLINNYCIESTGATGQMFVDIKKLYVSQSGIGVGSTGAANNGHIHIYIEDLYLSGSFAVGIRSQGGTGTSIVGYVHHILETGSQSNTYAFELAGGRISVISTEIFADTLAFLSVSPSNSSINVVCPNISVTNMFGTDVGNEFYVDLLNKRIISSTVTSYFNSATFSSLSATTLYSGTTDLNDLIGPFSLQSTTDVGNTTSNNLIVATDGTLGIDRRLVFKELDAGLSGASDFYIGQTTIGGGLYGEIVYPTRGLTYVAGAPVATDINSINGNHIFSHYLPNNGSVTIDFVKNSNYTAGTISLLGITSAQTGSSKIVNDLATENVLTLPSNSGRLALQNEVLALTGGTLTGSLFSPSISGTSVSATTFFSGSTNLGSLIGAPTYVAPGVNAYTGGTPSRPIVGVIGSPVFTAVTASSVSGTSISATTFYSGSTDLSTFFGQGTGTPTYVKPGVNISTGGTPSAPVINVVGSPVFTAVTATSLSGTSVSATTFYSGSTNLGSLLGGSVTYVQPGLNITTGGTPTAPIVGTLGTVVFTGITFSTSLIDQTGNASTGVYFKASGTGLLTTSNRFTYDTANGLVRLTLGSESGVYTTGGFTADTFVQAANFISGSTNLNSLFGPSTFITPGVNAYTGGTSSRPIVGVIGSPIFTAVTASSVSGTSISGATLFSGSSNLGTLFAPTTHTHTASQISDSSDAGKNLLTASTVANQLGFLGITKLALSSNYSNSGTGAENVTGLAFSVTAGRTYHVAMAGTWRGNNATNNPAFGFTFSTGTGTISFMGQRMSTTGPTYNQMGASAANTASAGAAGTITANADLSFQFQASISATTTGVVSFFIQVPANTTTIKTPTSMVIYEAG